MIYAICESLDANYGGPSVSIPTMLSVLNDDEYIFISVDCPRTSHNELIVKLDSAKWVKLKQLGPKPLKFSWNFILFLIRLRRNRDESQILYVNNLWNFCAFFPFIYRLLIKSSKLVVSPRGALFSHCWSKGKVRKNLAFWIFQRKMLALADVVLVTSKAEAECVARLVPTAKLRLLPNYLALPRRIPRESRGMTKLVYWGRIDPKKNIKSLIKSFSAVDCERLSELRLIGFSNCHSAYELEILNDLRARDRIDCVPFISRSEIGKLVDDARFFILPSYSENFANVVLEALALGIPVIVSDQTPWLEVEKFRCGFVCGTTPDSIQSAIEKAANVSDVEHEEMSKNAYNFARRYSIDDESVREDIQAFWHSLCR